MTDIPKGYTTLLLEGVAQHMEDNGLGRYIPDTDLDSVYAATDLAIVLKTVPAAPARLITLNTYSPQDSPVLPWSQVQVQFRVRAPHTECDDIADFIYGMFHRKRYLSLVAGYSTISSVHRVSSIPLGNDPNGWAERSDNYEFGAQRI
ncbi:MAG TPA: minor capsid protein [Arthrobacter sp.]